MTDSQPEKLIGTQIDKWELVRVLGSGGMAVVYEAKHTWLSNRAAIKLLHPSAYSEPAPLERFQREALIISKLNHPNIVEVRDFGEDPEHSYYMVMELLEGQSLEREMKRAPLPLGWVNAVVQQLCSALEAIHRVDVIHRDLKPSNVIVLPGDSYPTVKLIDFGIAKAHLEEIDEHLTNTNAVIGTPHYLAPEQIRAGRPVSQQTDLYALGVLIYRMLTGVLPLEGEGVFEHMMMVVQEEPLPLGHHRLEFRDTPLEALLTRMLAKVASSRPLSAEMVWQAWEKALPGERESLRVVTEAYGERKSVTTSTGSMEPELPGNSKDVEVSGELSLPPRFGLHPGLLFLLVGLLLGGIGWGISRQPSPKVVPKLRQRKLPVSQPVVTIEQLLKGTSFKLLSLEKLQEAIQTPKDYKSWVLWLREKLHRVSVEQSLKLWKTHNQFIQTFSVKGQESSLALTWNVRYQRNYRRIFQNLQNFHRDAKLLLERGMLQDVIRRSAKLWKRWKSFDAKLWRLNQHTMVVELQRWVSQSKQIRALWRQVQTLSQKGYYRKAGHKRKELRKLVEGHPAQKWLKQRLKRQAQREQRLQRLRRRAGRAYQRSAWLKARSFYRALLKQSPRLWDRAGLKKRIKACRCALTLFPWELCKKRDFPPHFRKTSK